MKAPLIVSAAPGPVSIVGGRTVPASAPAALPARSLGLGQFTVAPSPVGLPQLVDPQGRPCGLFASEQLASATAAGLSQ